MDRVVAGRFDELQSVKAQSDQGSPVAMYWWGAFLDACVFDGCDPQGARALWRKAAEAGNSSAKLALMVQATSIEGLDALMAQVGGATTVDEQLAYAGLLAALSLPPDTRGWDRARVALRELAAAEPRMIVLYARGALEGFNRYPDELRAMVEAGWSRAAEELRRWLLVADHSGYRELLARAKSGDLTLGIALCETVQIHDGFLKLPPDLLPICEVRLREGYLGLAPVLLRHHRVSGNTQAAAFYAELCASLPINCASELAEYYQDLSGESAAWELWDLVAGLSAGIDPSTIGKPPALMRQAFSIRVRDSVAEHTCASRRFNAASRAFDDDPACPWRKPIRIPTEFLGPTGKP